MRADIARILVDRPRSRAVSRGRPRQAKSFRLRDGEVSDAFCRTVVPMHCWRVYTERKEQRDHLSPLLRWLAHQVNRPWSDVWSEVCRVTDGRSVLQAHVRQHVLLEVDVDCHRRADGQLLVSGYELRQGLRERYFVEPETGLLRRLGKRNCQ
jgi:hypothetical protein